MKFKIYTLGCKVNDYESNVMRDKLLNSGYEETTSNADIVIINTCSVTDTGFKKSIKVVKRAIKDNDAYVIVTGCASQNKKESFLAIDGVDLVLGNIGKSKIVDYIKDRNTKEDVKDISKVPFIKRRELTLIYKTDVITFVAIASYRMLEVISEAKGKTIF